jgi:hypothetical protein
VEGRSQEGRSQVETRGGLSTEPGGAPASVSRAELEADVERVASSGSCARCGRSLDLASAKVDGRWYGNAICATGAPCPLDERAPEVPERRLYARPARFLRKRLPKELRASTRRRR